jgi:hypothetical protein
MESVELAPGHRISRVIKGGWQLAGGHGAVDRKAGVEDMIAFADAGITTFDCADIYTGVEAMIGDFRAEYERVRGAEALSKIKVHTKFVPDLGSLASFRVAMSPRHRDLAWTSQAGAARSGAVPLVGLRDRPAGRGGRMAQGAARRRQDRQYRRHQFRYHADAAYPGCGRAAGVHAGAILADR